MSDPRVKLLAAFVALAAGAAAWFVIALLARSTL
jgi:hypothetical protein